jgi:hypothetical protein
LSNSLLPILEIYRGVCFPAWKLFSKLLSDDDGIKSLGLYRHREHICQPTEELSHYLQPLTSPNFDFVSYLSINGCCSFTENELLCLADLKNLGVLEIIQPADDMRAVFPRISDRLIRGWVSRDNPFPLLRILRIWGDESTTRDSLQYATKLPSLALYDVVASRSDWEDAGEYATKHGWQMGETIYGIQESLLWYMMLFSSVEESKPKRLYALARNIDSDLMSVCYDHRCSVKLVPYGQAPSLLDYVNDGSKVRAWDADAQSADAQTCHAYAFESWAFWLYSFIGQLQQDMDLKRNGISVEDQAVVGPFVLPSKPLACLHLGHTGRTKIAPSAAYVRRGLFAITRHSFFKVITPGETQSENTTATENKSKSPAVSKTVQLPRPGPGIKGNGVRRQKRQKLDEMLHTFAEH